jgi:hypothetical protein
LNGHAEPPAIDIPTLYSIAAENAIPKFFRLADAGIRLSAEFEMNSC